MQRPFTTFATTRFLNRQAVIEALKECAYRLKAILPEVSVYLFGSFAAGRPTPRSDADIAVIVEESADDALLARVRDTATMIFLSAPVPVEIFVLSKLMFEQGSRTKRGVAGAVAHQGILLA